MAVIAARSQHPWHLLRAHPVRRWTALLGSLLLVLMLWTGTVAHAAEQLDCVPVAADTLGHYEGDSDQVPADPDKGVAHHHAGCGGHQIAAPSGGLDIYFADAIPVRPTGSSLAGLHGRSPDRQLRPPIA